MQVLGALIGVPATVLVAGGLGTIGLTVWNRLSPLRREPQPMRWGQVGLGAAMLVLGAALVEVEILLFGAG